MAQTKIGGLVFTLKKNGRIDFSQPPKGKRWKFR